MGRHESRAEAVYSAVRSLHLLTSFGSGFRIRGASSVGAHGIMKCSLTNEGWREDLAFAELQSHKGTLLAITGSTNESDTRLRAIDTLLFDILRWGKAEIETEKYCRAAGFSDYLFSINGSRSLILEAKRAGICFVLPDREYTASPYAFGLLAKECPEAMEALQQAAGYALAQGCRYVGISNGHQWLFALTFVPDQPLSERQVYVFESMNGIESKFRLFWDCFSRAGIQDNSACNGLLESRRVPAPPKFSARIAGYPNPAGRNVFANELSYILDLVWDTISQAENSEDFVNNCYISPEAHGELIDLATELFDRRRKDDEILLEYDISSIDALPHQLANLPSERPFVILGEVGRGKSSFLKYLRFVAARQHLAHYIQIDLDFVDRPDRTNEVPDFIYQEVARQLREKYEVDIYSDAFARGVLNLDLLRLQATPKGKLLQGQPAQYKEFEVEFIESAQKDTHVYLTKVMHHLKRGRNCSVALFFDNLDRRDGAIQEAAFLKSSSIARDWSALVFVCLRPSTFYESQERGVLDAIAPRTFTVGQPDLTLLLKKRFAYATSIALGRKAIGAPASKNIAFHLHNVAMIFDSCEFAARKRHGIIPMLEAVSNGNIRRLLDFAKMILSSRHLDTKKIVQIIENDGSYTIPDYEGVKSLVRRLYAVRPIQIGLCEPF